MNFTQKKAKFYNDPKLKNKIVNGEAIFEREYRQDINNKGYIKLLSKI